MSREKDAGVEWKCWSQKRTSGGGWSLRHRLRFTTKATTSRQRSEGGGVVQWERGRGGGRGKVIYLWGGISRGLARRKGGQIGGGGLGTRREEPNFHGL